MKKNIIIIGGSEEQLPLVETANEQNYTTHVFDLNPECKCSKYAHYFYPLSIYDPIPILQVAKKINPLFVQSIATEVGNKTANYISNKLNLISNSIHTAQWTTEKDKMKEVLKKNNISTPSSYSVQSLKDIHELKLSFPFIIKAADRTGGRGVQLIHESKQIADAYQEAYELSYNKKILVEEYFEGDQYSVETISYQGKHQIVEITEQYYTNPPNFVEHKDIIPARIDESIKDKIKEITERTLTALDVKIGASHLELRINFKNEIKIIEIASRMGGGFRNELIKLSSKNNFVKMLLDACSGKEPQLLSNSNKEYAILKWICNTEDYEKYQLIQEKYPNYIIRQQVQKVPANYKATNGSERKGYYIMKVKDKHLISKLT